MSDDLVATFVEVKLGSDENFLKVKETLSRIGIASKKDKTLYQSCHILHKKGLYYIVHFKELFLLDGKYSTTTLTEEDKSRRNIIAKLLADWELVTLVTSPLEPMGNIGMIKIIPFKDKKDWTLVTKHSIGNKI